MMNIETNLWASIQKIISLYLPLLNIQKIYKFCKVLKISPGFIFVQKTVRLRLIRFIICSQVLEQKIRLRESRL